MSEKRDYYYTNFCLHFSLLFFLSTLQTQKLSSFLTHFMDVWRCWNFIKATRAWDILSINNFHCQVHNFNLLCFIDIIQKLITHCCNKADTLNPPIMLCFVSLERLPWTTKWKIKFWPHLMLIHNQFSAISTVSHDLRVQNALTTTLSGLSTSIVCRLAVKSRAYGCVNMNINSFPSFLSLFPSLLACMLAVVSSLLTLLRSQMCHWTNSAYKRCVRVCSLPIEKQ